MNSLNRDRLYILKTVSYNPTFIIDKYVPYRVKSVLCDFRKPLSYDILKIENCESSSPGQALADLYKEYGIGIISCLLKYFYLVYSKSDLEQKLKPIMDVFRSDISENKHYIPKLLSELNQYAHAPFESLEDFIDILIFESCKCSDYYNYILFNDNFTFELKLITFKQLVRNKEKFHILINYLAYMVNSKEKHDFHTRIFPLILEYSETGYEGFKVALEAFNGNEFKKHGPLILASFGDVFAQNIFDEQPNIDLVRAIFISLAYIQNRQFRDRLILMLIDRWCSNLEIAAETKKNISNEMQKNRTKFLGTFSDYVIDKIQKFKIIDSKDFWDKIRNIEIWTKDGTIFRLKELPQDFTTGRQVAYSLSNLKTDEEKMYLLENTKIFKSYKFYKGFFNTIIKKEYFLKLSAAIQFKIISHDKFTENINYESLNKLKRLTLEDSIKERILNILSIKERSFRYHTNKKL